MFSKPIVTNVALVAGAVATVAEAHVLAEVDFDAVGETREFALVPRFKGNATPPGAGRTVTFNLYFSNDKLTNAQVVAQFTASTHASGNLGLVNSANATTRAVARFVDISSTLELTLRPLARYMYVAYLKTTEDGGAITTLESLRLVKLRTGR